MTSNDKSLIILFGGQSRERLVSVATAQNLARVLPHARLWFASPDGKVFEVGQSELAKHERPFEFDFKPDTDAIAVSLAQALDRFGADGTFFLGTHGGDSENGVYQRLFEQRRIPFTASGSEASERAFHKQKAKEIVEKAGMRVCSALSVYPTKQTHAAIESFFAKHKNIVAKPVADGSSYGLFFIRTRQDLDAFFAAQESNDPIEYLLEPYISGIEVTGGVIQHKGQLVGLPLVEIRPKANRQFDYAGKYLGAGVDEICPAEVPEKWAKVARQMAVTAHQSLGCYGYSRTDMIIDDNGPVFLEINTLPGMTKTSLLPKALAEYGLAVPEFIEEQVKLAQDRYLTSK